MRKSSLFIGVMLWVSFGVWAQQAEFKYQRSINYSTLGWARIYLPTDLSNKVQKDLDDIRIIGETSSNTIVEAPFYLEPSRKGNQRVKEIVQVINEVFDDKGVYFTFKLDAEELVNHIELSMRATNFNWKVKLEGSQDLKNWKTILDDYQIIRLRKGNMNYLYSTLEFDDVSYRYFRLFVPTQDKNILQKAQLSLWDKNALVFEDIAIEKQQIAEQNKETVVYLDYDTNKTLDRIDLTIANDYEYYRNCTIEYLKDSVKTRNGWRYNYRILTSSVLSSIHGSRSIILPPEAKGKIRIKIKNYDDEPLDIANIKLSTVVRSLVVRFNQEADYSLVYGHPVIEKGIYDIVHFKDEAVPDLQIARLGKEQERISDIEETDATFFSDQRFLWGVMIIVIVLLLWFSLKMINNHEK